MGDRVLATLLFTDIVGSTERAASIGDGPWNRLLEQHNETVRAVLERYRGVEIASTGDGFLVTFDGAARAAHAALRIRDAVRTLNLEIRGAVHTGEVEVIAGNLRGLAVHEAARIQALAEPGEVLVLQYDTRTGIRLWIALRGSWHPPAEGGSVTEPASSRCRA